LTAFSFYSVFVPRLSPDFSFYCQNKLAQDTKQNVLVENGSAQGGVCKLKLSLRHALFGYFKKIATRLYGLLAKVCWKSPASAWHADDFLRRLYLGRYLYKSIIQEKDIINSENGMVTFRYLDSKTKKL